MGLVGVGSSAWTDQVGRSAPLDHDTPKQPRTESVGLCERELRTRLYAAQLQDLLPQGLLTASFAAEFSWFAYSKSYSMDILRVSGLLPITRVRCQAFECPSRCRVAQLTKTALCDWPGRNSLTHVEQLLQTLSNQIDCLHEGLGLWFAWGNLR
jgi:hypothetical protein